MKSAELRDSHPMQIIYCYRLFNEIAKHWRLRNARYGLAAIHRCAVPIKIAAGKPFSITFFGGWWPPVWIGQNTADQCHHHYFRVFLVISLNLLFINKRNVFFCAIISRHSRAACPWRFHMPFSYLWIIVGIYLLRHHLYQTRADFDTVFWPPSRSKSEQNKWNKKLFFTGWSISDGCRFLERRFFSWVDSSSLWLLLIVEY